MSNLALVLSDADHAATPNINLTTANLLKGDKWDTWENDIRHDGDMTYSGVDQPVSMRDLVEGTLTGSYQTITRNQTVQINYSAGKI